jgi:hypothetical protein
MCFFKINDNAPLIIKLQNCHNPSTYKPIWAKHNTQQPIYNYLQKKIKAMQPFAV